MVGDRGGFISKGRKEFPRSEGNVLNLDWDGGYTSIVKIHQIIYLEMSGFYYMYIILQSIFLNYQQ